MGQSCSHDCSYSPRAALGGRGRSINNVCAPKPAAVPVRCPIAKDEDGLMPFHSHAFQIAVARSEDEPRNSRTGWRAAYTLGPLLGDGISAKVYEAEALPVPSLEPGSRSLGETGILGTCGRIGMPPCRERSRRVAIKRFHRFGSRTFQKELSALRRVGVHPHVLRLLESYQGFDGEDVLILEYCDGSTLYDLYAREHPNGGLPERLVARLIRQLLLALEHLNMCDVEHQDVKPENMMLYDVSVSAQSGELKLGDFGWATVTAPTKVGGGVSNEVPSTGAGSLWYAPPELNPPVDGIMPDYSTSVDSRGLPLKGRSDMWSVGVVLYLLLVGHNPFNRALKQPTQEAIDAEVMRLSALGQFNNRAERWLQLHLEARDMISVLLRVKPSARPSASEALRHPFLLRRVPKASECDDYEESVFFHGSISGWGGREAAWRRLDGMQRLGWAAVARALAEPELESSVVTGALEGMHSTDLATPPWEGTYLWQLARELATTPVFHWLRERGAWPDVVRLAFCYLDLDGDGLLGPSDLAGHVARQGARSDAVFRESAPQARSGALAAASRWITRWRDPGQPLVTTAGGEAALTIGGLREALLVSHHVDDAIFGELDALPPGGARSESLANDFGISAGKEEEISWRDLPAAPAARRVDAADDAEAQR
uniref:Protein kinase domain-containing protein n=1 Tax=Alexandrium catenella TaxID=2925 RepID=A0A7S1WTL5_ALECA|mmetsp:Transcript_89200/g.237076  ORF Transcript_89200/g.237076 Transcript_89200/m.237076 type:complete len:658 (+) Transcript_89200:77-2050(+)